MKCTYEGCDAPAEYRYAWRWGETGACCSEHQGHVKTHCMQLQHPELAFTPIPVAKDELAQALGIIRELARQLRRRIEEGLLTDPETVAAGEELARRIRNAPAPFADALQAIRDVGTTLIGNAVGDARIAQQREFAALARIVELERLLALNEQALQREREQAHEQLTGLRVSLDKAQGEVVELQRQVDDPDPPPSTEPPPAPLNEPRTETDSGELRDLFEGESKVEGTIGR